MINIVFITDKNYVFPTKVAIKSLIANKNRETQYNINIIGVELDENDVFLFKNLETDNVKINIIQKDNDYENIGFNHQYVSKAALFKFQIPNIFNDLDKVLYLDGDMIIEKDLSELYNIDLGNNYAGMVIDYNIMSNFKHKSKKYNDFLGVSNYFNSGMILFNIKQCLHNNITDKLFKIKKKDKICYFMDQDAFNLAFKGKIKILSPYYNFFASYFKFSLKNIKDFFKLDASNFNELFNETFIIHFAGMKPWNDINAVKSDEFWKYVDNIDVIKYILSNNRNVLKQCYNEKINLLEEQNNTLKQRITNLEQKISFLEKKIKLPKWLGNLICGFIPSKKNRHNFREKYIKNN